MHSGRWFWAVLLELWEVSPSDGCVCQCRSVMQQELSLFFGVLSGSVEDMQSQTESFLSLPLELASMCHGKCWHGTFPLSHSFARTAQVSVTCVSVVYFSSVSVAWQCFNHWSFLHLVLIMWGPLDSHPVVCLWGHCCSLCPREALDAAVCSCSLQSSAVPWHSGLTSCLTCCWSHCQCCPKLPGLPESTEMWGRQNWRAAGREECWEKQPQKDQCSPMHHKYCQRNSLEFLLLHGGGAKPLQF